MNPCDQDGRSGGLQLEKAKVGFWSLIGVFVECQSAWPVCWSPGLTLTCQCAWIGRYTAEATAIDDV